MRKLDLQQLQSYQEDSHVSHSVLPGSAEALTMTVTSGQKCLESYKSSSPLGLLVKMCLESSAWRSTRCLLSWKQKVTKSNVSLFQLAVSAPLTGENDVQSSGIDLARSKTLRKMLDSGMISDMELESILDQNSTDEQSKNLREWIIQYEQTFFGLIPTARASDYKGAMLCRFWAPHPELVHAEKNKRYHSQLHEHLELTPRGKIGQMNPNWIEWLMGFPIGWTELSA